MKPAAPVTRIGRALPPAVYAPTGAGSGTDSFSMSCSRRRARSRGLAGRCGAELQHLARQTFDLFAQQVVLVELSPEERRGDVDLFLQALRREHVQVSGL